MLRLLKPQSVPLDIQERIAPELLSTAMALATRNRYDVVWAAGSWIGELALKCGFRRVIVDVNDFEGALLNKYLDQVGFFGRAPFHRLLAHQLERYEQRLVHRFSSVVLTKPDDARRYDARHHGRLHIFGNGVDVPPLDRSVNALDIDFLFVGMLGYEPNCDAIEWFVKEVLPRITNEIGPVSVCVAGKGPVPPRTADVCASSDVRIVESPASLAPYYATSKAVIAPIRLGNGTRLKVLEALAFHRPLVATSEAISGLDIRDGIHLRVADSAPEFAKACTSMLANVDESARLAAQGYERVVESYSWSSALSGLPALIRSVAEGRS
jgi:glycosyltransferase involved in cell wall biosynthesis